MGSMVTVSLIKTSDPPRQCGICGDAAPAGIGARSHSVAFREVRGKEISIVTAELCVHCYGQLFGKLSRGVRDCITTAIKASLLGDEE